MQPIYLDYNATTPIDPAVADAMLPYLRTHFGNPSSSHPYGVAAKRAIENARAQVAALLGCRPEEVVFTSGGSESNNTVIRGVASALGQRGRRIVTSAVEHPAVLEPCRALEAEGFQVTYLPVDGRGRVDPGELERALGDETILVSVMHANNEVGTVQPIAALAALARARGVPFHSDAAQSIGKILVRVDELGVDFLTVAGHKLYAPKGVGALYLRPGRALPRFVHGAGHESNRRAGTENVLGIVGLGKAAELAAARLAQTGRDTRRLRDRLHAGLRARLGELRVNGDPEDGLPNTLSVCFAGVDASALLAEVGERVAASAGAACHADGVALSSVLEAMRVPVREAMGTVRFSLGRGTTDGEVDEAAAVVAEAVERLRGRQDPPAVAASDGTRIRLTRFTHGMGCGCKLRAQDLETVLRGLPASADPELLVGLATRDDAAVYRVAADLAIVQTVDFFTPVCDDPGDFGAIGAANALSDVYAMGAQPRFALSVVGFPSRRLPLRVLEEILAGAAEVAREAGIEIVGGHSVDDTEPKFGLVVTGTVHPGAVLTNSGARAGDALFLTKPIGTGILAAAASRDLAPAEHVAAGIAVMRALNRDAAAALRALGGVHACTDVTGFGLLGHLRRLALASAVDVALDVDRVPVLEGVRELAAADLAPGATLDNLADVSPHVSWCEGVSRVDQALLADAQSSGGLLVSVAAGDAAALAASFAERGVAAARIGEVTGTGIGRIVCRRG